MNLHEIDVINSPAPKPSVVVSIFKGFFRRTWYDFDDDLGASSLLLYSDKSTS